MTTLKNKALLLRKQQKTYTEIQQILGQKIPKSTLSHWCRDLKMSDQYKDMVRQKNHDNLKHARIIALQSKKDKKESFLTTIRKQAPLLRQLFNNQVLSKLILAILYMCEGSRSKGRSSLMFGNSDPFIVSLFMRLLRFCYSIDETKFRCTVQCRDDQDTKELEQFWSKITNIPKNQFYKARVDPRTIGKPSKKPNYKGVCRIDYFSSRILNELSEIMNIIR